METTRFVVQIIKAYYLMWIVWYGNASPERQSLNVAEVIGNCQYQNMKHWKNERWQKINGRYTSLWPIRMRCHRDSRSVIRMVRNERRTEQSEKANKKTAAFINQTYRDADKHKLNVNAISNKYNWTIKMTKLIRRVWCIYNVKHWVNPLVISFDKWMTNYKHVYNHYKRAVTITDWQWYQTTRHTHTHTLASSV